MSFKKLYFKKLRIFVRIKTDEHGEYKRDFSR